MSTAARPKLAAARREITGKKVANLRRAGRLPAVVFGRGLPSDNVSVDTHEFEQLRRHAGANTLIDLSVDGGASAPVLVHGVQTSVVTRRPGSRRRQDNGPSSSAGDPARPGFRRPVRFVPALWPWPRWSRRKRYPCRRM